MRSSGVAISIWFFIGITLFVYGILITGVGAMNLSVPADRLSVLGTLHADLWWGILLVVLGGYYSWAFRPTKR